MKIVLSSFGYGDVFFEASIKYDKYAYTSESIAKLLNLDVDLYNQLLIDKVIKHDNYTIDKFDKDLSFAHNNISEETYINRFKETFINQLTLITLSS